tara:strand:+ start:2068 stop:2196 length:129 start_codon:yes stop_codon:yes gene_type:complete
MILEKIILDGTKKWSLNFENFSKAWEALKDLELKFRNCKCQK